MDAATTAMRRPVVDQIFGDNKAPAEEVLATDFADLIAEAEAMTAKAKALPGKVGSDDMQARFGGVITDMRALYKRVDNIRTAEGKPLLAAQRAVNGFFNVMKEAIEAAAKPLNAAADNYVRQKAAEERERREREAEAARRKAEAERQKAEQAKTDQAAARAEGRAEALDARAEEAEQAATGTAADLTRTRTAGVTSTARTDWTFRIEDYESIDLNRLRDFIKREAVEQAIRSIVRIQKGNTSIPGVAVFEDVKASFRR